MQIPKEIKKKIKQIRTKDKVQERMTLNDEEYLRDILNQFEEQVIEADNENVDINKVIPMCQSTLYRLKLLKKILFKDFYVMEKDISDTDDSTFLYLLSMHPKIEELLDKYDKEIKKIAPEIHKEVDEEIKNNPIKVTAKIVLSGNSLAVNIPSEILKKKFLKRGDNITLYIDGKTA